MTEPTYTLTQAECDEQRELIERYAAGGSTYAPECVLAALKPNTQEPVARLLYWNAPKHFAIPHGGVAARTYAEYPVDTPVEQRYWFEGPALFDHPAQMSKEDAQKVSEALKVSYPTNRHNLPAHNEAITIMQKLVGVGK